MREIIRKTILLTLLLISISVFVTRNRLWVMQHNPLSPYKCDIPVTYTVGAVDPRFGVSQEKFVAMMQKAEQAWETALGRDVFRLEIGGRVKVNLTYDTRQMTTEELKKIGATIDSSKEKTDQSVDSYKSLVAQLEQQKNSYTADGVKYEKTKQDYESAASQYQKDLQDYNQSVASWNSRGGATGNDYDKIAKQKNNLDQQYKDLKNQENTLKLLNDNLEKKRQAVNDLVAKVNALGGTVNQLAGQTNANVANYNQTKEQRGEFETGLYTYNNGVESIDIFQFADDKDLLAVLIHEMGHALGLAHATNPNAIMYPKLVNQSTSITPDDIALFQTTCVK
jgi:predicted  nucleic acid-binding Zn-ribbon protein